MLFMNQALLVLISLAPVSQKSTNMLSTVALVSQTHRFLLVLMRLTIMLFKDQALLVLISLARMSQKLAKRLSVGVPISQQHCFPSNSARKLAQLCFSSSGLTSLDLSGMNVTKISQEAFQSCSALVSFP